MLLGVRPTQPEYWVAPALYGMPLLLLSWPLYYKLLSRTGMRPFLKPVIGAALFPIPGVLLHVGHWAFTGESVASPLHFFDGYYLLFFIWYALFGFSLGSLLAIVQLRRERTERSAPS